MGTPRLGLSPADIVEGGLYVKESKGLVREVWQVTPEGKAHWRSYWLDTGEPTGDSFVCSQHHLSRWADRAATPEEAARMNTEYGHLADVARAEDLTLKVIKMIPDHLLLEEVRSRGLKLDD